MSDQSLDNTVKHKEFVEPLLPRSAWNSQLNYLKAVFRAKKALDLVKKETSVI